MVPLFTLPPTCISASPPGSINLTSHRVREISHYLHLNLPLGVTNEGREAIRELIRPKCITILYQNSPLYIDIFHFMVLFLCCFGLFYTVCNFPVPKQQTPDSAVKSGHQVVQSEDLQMS